ncbi:hypothetical protein ACCO45_007875 [Purpureocillium lilacinum]|uniref:Uncharacterized protein n=1 Tax=Purpureocillium lilacinum TaxID=33203 RepID=A0ACC4DMH7_PURLI
MGAKVEPRRNRQKRATYQRTWTSPASKLISATYHEPVMELSSDAIRTAMLFFPNLKGISNHHFSLTFDDANRLIVRDWGSLLGTEVTYDAQGHGKRSNFRWIVSGDPNPEEKTSIRITVHDTVEFQIVAAHHDLTSPDYIAKVNWFRQGTTSTEDLFRDLGVPQRPDTELPTGAHTPGRGRDLPAEGDCNGSEYALKEPTARALRKGQVNYNGWREEARIMGQISHVPPRRPASPGDFQPASAINPGVCPPAGSLEDQEFITADETISILQQCLSALTYLHESEPPIVHRDIKPGNILLQHRYPGSIYVMFADFGLARDSSELSTFCGSALYLAPEVYLEWQSICSNTTPRKKYTPAVDVWSLGVVISELKCCLPRYKNSYRDRGTVWCDKIVKVFHEDFAKWPDALGQFLLDKMVVVSPESRSSARDCYTLAALLPSAAEGGCVTPRPVPYAGEEEQTTVRYGPTGYEADNQATVQLPTAYAVDCTTTSYEGEFVRSEAPPPDTLPPTSKGTQKRTAMFEASRPQSSSARRTTSRQEDHNRRSYSTRDQNPELAHFLEDYSSDAFDPVYVGSSLASWAAEGESGTCEGQSSHGPAVQCQLDNTDAQIDFPQYLYPLQICLAYHGAPGSRVMSSMKDLSPESATVRKLMRDTWQPCCCRQ